MNNITKETRENYKDSFKLTCLSCWLSFCCLPLFTYLKSKAGVGHFTIGHFTNINLLFPFLDTIFS